MLNRSNLYLAILLLLQTVLLAVAVITSTSTETRPTEPILREFSLEAVEQITIADDREVEVTLARGEAGWVLPHADDFPVNSAKVEELLGKIAGLNTGRLVASNPASFARLEVKDTDFRRRLDILTDSSTEVLYLGGSGGVDTVYTRRDGDSHVYLGVGLSSWEVSPEVSAWIDTSYVNVPQDDVLELSLRNANGSFSFQREGEGWIYDGLGENEAFDTAQMAGMLRNAASIRMVEPLGLEARDEYALDEPAIMVEVAYRQAVEVEETGEADETEAEIEYAEQSYTLAIGAQQDREHYVLKSSSKDYYVLVRQSVVDAFGDVNQDMLVTSVESESAADTE